MKEIRHDELIELMRVRYDFYSARAVLERAVQDAGLSEKACYPPAEVLLIADQIASRKQERIDELVAQLRRRAAAADGPEPAARKVELPAKPAEATRASRTRE